MIAFTAFTFPPVVLGTSELHRTCIIYFYSFTWLEQFEEIAFIAAAKRVDSESGANVSIDD